MITLTFDNGPDPEVTPRVLDILGERGVPAWFFVVGNAVRRSPDLVAAARAQGHSIGNHSMTHSVPLGSMPSPKASVAEIADAASLIDSRVFRPFGGGGIIGPHLLSQAAVDFLRADGWTVALWTCVPRDWEDPKGWPSQVSIGEWDVVVLHDLPDCALDRLPDFLDSMLDRGESFTTELPRSCTPILDGAVVGALEGIVA